jgi:hypothetical protein
VLVDGKAYALAYHFDRGELVGYRLTSTECQYDLPADLSHCECGDFAYRSRPGGCKHCVTVRACQRTGKVA